MQHARDAEWKPGFRGFFDYRDLGMVEKTGGKLRAHVHRPNGPSQGAGDLHYHKLDFQMVYVLKGWARVHFDGVGEILMEEGSCMYQEPEIRHRVIEYSDDYTALEEAAVDAWRTAVLDAALMKTVCAAPYLERATLK